MRPYPSDLEKRMQQLFKKTDKEYINTLPRYTYEGKIVVVQSEAEAKRATAVLSKSPIVGIDTETRPAFRRGVHHKVALLQAANEEVCFLFRLNQTGFLPCLQRLLASPKVFKVGLSLKDDFLMLRQREPSFIPAAYVDLQDYVKQMGIEDMSLQKLYANVFRMRLSKAARLSNWEADVLSEAQKLYAAADAVTCIQLYKRLDHLRHTGDYQLIDQSVNETTVNA